LKTGASCVAQAGLELMILLPWLPIAGIIDTCHHAQLKILAVQMRWSGGWIKLVLCAQCEYLIVINFSNLWRAFSCKFTTIRIVAPFHFPVDWPGF
jgi:hypothetical protein